MTSPNYRPDYEYSLKPKIYTLKPYSKRPYKTAYRYSYTKIYDYKPSYKYQNPYGYSYALYSYKYKPGYRYKYIYSIPYKRRYTFDYKLNVPVFKLQGKMPFKFPKPAFVFKNMRSKLMSKVKRGKKKGFRELLADLLSIQIAQNIWGKATQPALTRKVWAYEAKSAIGFVPTAEMLKTGRPERFRRPKLGLRPIKLKSLINLIKMG